jgi:hypothetical protein
MEVERGAALQERRGGGARSGARRERGANAKRHGDGATLGDVTRGEGAEGRRSGAAAGSRGDVAAGGEPFRFPCQRGCHFTETACGRAARPHPHGINKLVILERNPCLMAMLAGLKQKQRQTDESVEPTLRAMEWRPHTFVMPLSAYPLAYNKDHVSHPSPSFCHLSFFSIGSAYELT